MYGGGQRIELVWEGSGRQTLEIAVTCSTAHERTRVMGFGTAVSFVRRRCAHRPGAPRPGVTDTPERAAHRVPRIGRPVLALDAQEARLPGGAALALRERAAMRLPPWLALALGVVGAGAGLLPWLVHGARLPLQNLASTPDPGPGPVVLLPFSQYAVVTMAALLVTGGALTGTAARLSRRPRPILVRLALLLGTLAVQAIAIVQTALVVGGRLQDRPESGTYLGLLVAGSIAAALVGALVMLLLVAERRGAVVAGVALAVVLLPSWLDTLVTAPVQPNDGPIWLLSVTRWVAPVVTGLAVAWSGLRTPGRIAAALLGVLALWLGPALVTALLTSVGTRAYAHDPAEMLRAGVDTLRSALGALDVVAPTLFVAAAVAAVGIGARAAVLRRVAAGDG